MSLNIITDEGLTVRCWGKHVSLDAKGCNDKVKDKEAILAFGKKLIELIDMVPHGEPQIEYFGSGDKAGWTYSQLIVTSNVCGHFCDEDRACYLDIFSCKDFDPRDVAEFFRCTFEPTLIQYTTNLRGVW